MGKRFILKTLKKEYRDNPAYRNLLYKEFEIGYHLSHANIMQTVTMEHVKGLADTIVMEYIDGITLAEAIERGLITSDVARRVIGQICDALQYIHSLQQIHRDLKPENVMLTRNGQNVKLIDFGLSDSDAHTIFKHPAGTRSYASPELINGDKIDNRSDIYALGVLIERMTSNRRMRAIARRCQAADRNMRYADAGEVKAAVMRRSLLHRLMPLIAMFIAVVTTAVVTLMLAGGERREIVVDPNSAVSEAMSQMFSRVDSIANSRYTKLFGKLASVETYDQWNEFCEEQMTLFDAMTCESVEMLRETIDTSHMLYREYKLLTTQQILDIHTRYHQMYSDQMVEVMQRINQSL